MGWVGYSRADTHLSMDAPNPTDPLSRALADWRVAPRRTAEFRALVQARLAGGGATGELSWTAYARRHIAGVAGALALALALGAFGGQEIARARAAAQSARLATAYVQGLDARAMTMR